MEISIKCLANRCAAATLIAARLFSANASADEAKGTVSDGAAKAKAADGPPPTTASGLSSTLYFTDENGERRQPTAAEVQAAAEAFQKDLAKIAGKHKGKPNVRRYANGTVAATVALSRMELLTVHENDDGTLTFGHTTMDAEGNVVFHPVSAPALPEK